MEKTSREDKAVQEMLESPGFQAAAEENKRKDEELDALLSCSPPIRMSIGMGLQDGVFYYGVKIWHPQMRRFIDGVITSEKRLYLDTLRKIRNGKETEFKGANEIRDELGIDYKHGFLSDALSHHWSQNETAYSIKAFLNGDVEDVDGKELFDALMEENKRFIYHVDKITHTLVALYIMATYVLHLFSEMGRMHLIGAAESGKTSQCRLISFYCFNPISLASMTESYLYNAVESTSGTIILDDLDDLADEMKRALRHVDKVGYKKEFAKRGSMAQDRSGRTNTDRYFCAFVKNSIDDLEAVSASRNFIIDMTKVPSGIRLDKIRRNAKPKQELRDKLHVWALQHYAKILQNYAELPDIKDLTARQEEIAAPLLAVARTIDEELYTEMCEFFPKRAISQKEQSEQGTLFVMALKEMLELTPPNGDVVKVKLSDITARISMGQEASEKQSISIRLGREFAKYRAVIKCKKKSNAVSYEVSKDDLLGFMHTRGYLDMLMEDLSDGWKTEVKSWEKRTLSTT